MIEQLAAEGRSRDEIRTIVMQQFNLDATAAEFMIAVALGEIAGDVVAVDQDGNEQNDPYNSAP